MTFISTSRLPGAVTKMGRCSWPPDAVRLSRRATPIPSDDQKPTVCHLSHGPNRKSSSQLSGVPSEVATTAKPTTLCEGAGARHKAHQKDAKKKTSVAHRKLL